MTRKPTYAADQWTRAEENSPASIRGRGQTGDVADRPDSVTWPCVPIGTLCERTGVEDPQSRSSFRYVDISSIDRLWKRIIEAQEIEGSAAPSRARKAIRAGDVLVSTVRPNLNAVAVVPDHLDGEIASTGFAVLRPKRQGLSARYLYYYCWTPDFVTALSAKVRGAQYPAVSDEDVRGVSIPLPAPSEQGRIVEILDRADRLRRLRAKADAKADRILPALFIKMFGDPATNPMGWPTLMVRDAGEVQLGRQRAPRYHTGTCTRPYVRVANVFEDRIDVSDVLSMDFDVADFRIYRLQQGDILLNEGQSTELVGRPAMWRDEITDCCFQNTLVRFRANRNVVEPGFALGLFLSWFRSGHFARISAKTSSVAHLGAGRFANLSFPCPPLSLQLRYSSHLVHTQAVISGRAATHRRLDDLFYLVLRQAFSGWLTASWRESHMTELLQEMEHQAKLLAEVTL